MPKWMREAEAAATRDVQYASLGSSPKVVCKVSGPSASELKLYCQHYSVVWERIMEQRCKDYFHSAGREDFGRRFGISFKRHLANYLGGCNDTKKVLKWRHWYYQGYNARIWQSIAAKKKARLQKK